MPDYVNYFLSNKNNWQYDEKKSEKAGLHTAQNSLSNKHRIGTLLLDTSRSHPNPVEVHPY